MPVSRQPQPYETLPSVAIQYKEIDRRPGKFADIVSHNSQEIAKVLGVPVREATLPNGTKEGTKTLTARIDGDKLVIPLGHWLVLQDSRFKVYSPQAYAQAFS